MQTPGECQQADAEQDCIETDQPDEREAPDPG